MDENTSLTPQEIAEQLKINKNTVYGLIRRGELSAYKVGKKLRVDRTAVEEYKRRSRNFPREKTETAASMPGTAPDFVICGQDVLLDVLARHLETRMTGLRVLRSYLGSYDALRALYTGSVQVTTAHLWDAASDSYNLPYVRALLPGNSACMYRLAGRMEGFYVAKGNPKGITGWEDLRREDITLVNRERGSGARVLLDERLRCLGVPTRGVKGYENECTSHLTVASTVARGDADVGIGIEKAAMQFSSVEFIPLQREQLDLVFKAEDAEKPAFRAVVEILQSEAFKRELSGFGGYDLARLGMLLAKT